MKQLSITLIILLGIYSCKPSSKQSSTAKVKAEKVLILDSLLHPWSMAFLSEEEVLITEKDRKLIKANLSTKEKNIIKGFPDDLVDSIRVKDFRDNSGLFEVIKHPRFEENHFIYVSYAAESNEGTTTKIIRASLKEDSLSDVKSIFLAEPYRFDLFHYGGGMTFGQDGKLYVTIGERFYNEIDQPALPVAQDLNDRRGKIHRLNEDGSIPKDNPTFEGESLPSIYASGIRAAQGIHMDPVSGQIWFSEHGSVQGDELNLLKPGANYGWPIETTGKYRNKTFSPPKIKNAQFTPPKYYWLQTIAPSGLTSYHGDEFPQWKGDLILSGLSRGSLWRIHLEDNEVVSLEELFVNDRVRSRKVASSPEGKLYMLTDEKNGKLIQIRNVAKP
ncbi:MAG: PQQ-dependent sugar dehydrogenase [Bacteroidia bacterium]|nr:PQQ-dependent sugar dehydrogenase [Bacteroidia bacterium]